MLNKQTGQFHVRKGILIECDVTSSVILQPSTLELNVRSLMENVAIFKLPANPHSPINKANGTKIYKPLHVLGSGKKENWLLNA